MDSDVLEKIINDWGDNHGRTFNASNRKERLAELIMDLVYNGFNRSRIEMSKEMIMRKMVGNRSPFGQRSLKEWRIAASDDFRAAILNAFVASKKRDGEITIAPETLTLTPEEIAQREEQARKDYEEFEKSLNEDKSEIISSKPDESDDTASEETREYTNDPVLRPELDRSKFRDIETTPIMSVDEFLATVERENNER